MRILQTMAKYIIQYIPFKVEKRKVLTHMKYILLVIVLICSSNEPIFIQNRSCLFSLQILTAMEGEGEGVASRVFASGVCGCEGAGGRRRI